VPSSARRSSASCRAWSPACSCGSAWAACLGRFERALWKAIDGLFLTADAYGRLTGNRAPRDFQPVLNGTPRRVLVVEEFDGHAAPPGGAVRIVALRRPFRPDRAARRAQPVTFLEDDGTLRRAQALAWLLTRRRGPSSLRVTPAVALAAQRALRLGEEVVDDGSRFGAAVAQLVRER
jgi:hypothetical protein